MIYFLIGLLCVLFILLFYLVLLYLLCLRNGECLTIIMVVILLFLYRLSYAGVIYVNNKLHETSVLN